MNALSCRRIAVVGLAVLVAGISAHAAGDEARGAKIARSCLACHSFSPGRNLTGPSLAGIVGRKAGAAPGFGRYSDALKSSDLTWDEAHLDAWIRDPAKLVPGNAMRFPGIDDASTRADLVAYLAAVSAGRTKPPDHGLPQLKDADAASRVTAITQEGDAYTVTTADGKTRTFWEFNLRFKTDGSVDGPARGHPVMVPNGMQGDRASVIFSRLDEIARFVRTK